MKKILLIGLGLLLIGSISNAQVFSWGIKGGLNSSKISFDDFSIDSPPRVSIDPLDVTQDDFFITLEDGTNIINPDYINITAPKVSFTPSSYEMGYHFGAFARFKILGVFLQPELIFSQTNATINIEDGDPKDIASQVVSTSTNIKFTNFDVPVMVGVKLGPLRLNGGPVATFKLGNQLGTIKDELSADAKEYLSDFSNITTKATFGGQVGVGLDILKKVTLDVRYEFPLSKLGDQIELAGETFTTDQRQSQIIGSIGIMF